MHCSSTMRYLRNRKTRAHTHTHRRCDLFGEFVSQKGTSALLAHDAVPEGQRKPHSHTRTHNILWHVFCFTEAHQWPRRRARRPSVGPKASSPVPVPQRVLVKSLSSPWPLSKTKQKKRLRTGRHRRLRALARPSARARRPRILFHSGSAKCAAVGVITAERGGRAH